MNENKATTNTNRTDTSRSIGCNLNLDYLIELSGGDKEFIAEIVDMFIVDAPEVLRQSQTYLKNEDFELLKITVHKLKSSVQIMGNMELAGLIQTIENNAANPEMHSTLAELLINMNKEVTTMVEYLKQEKPNLLG